METFSCTSTCVCVCALSLNSSAPRGAGVCVRVVVIVQSKTEKTSGDTRSRNADARRRRESAPARERGEPARLPNCARSVAAPPAARQRPASLPPDDTSLSRHGHRLSLSLSRRSRSLSGNATVLVGLQVWRGAGCARPLGQGRAARSSQGPHVMSTNVDAEELVAPPPVASQGQQLAIGGGNVSAAVERGSVSSVGPSQVSPSVRQSVRPSVG